MKYFTWNTTESPWTRTEFPWNLMESLWSLNYKTSTYLQGKSMKYFIWNPMGSSRNGNSMWYETGIAVLQYCPEHIYRYWAFSTTKQLSSLYHLSL